jgi:hypothetical protein
MLYAGDILQYPPGIPFPALQELTLWDCNLRDDIFEPNWIPAGLRRLDIHCEVKDKLAAHLARMTNLSDIIISGFSLSTPLALPENCAWRRVQVFDLANDLERAVGMHWPSNWPPEAYLSPHEEACQGFWVMRSAERASFARTVAASLASLPLRRSDGTPAQLHFSIGGTHGSPSTLIPLSAFVTSIELMNPTTRQIWEVSANLPLVRKLAWPGTLAGLACYGPAENLALVAGLIKAPNIVKVNHMPYDLVLDLAVNVERNLEIHVSSRGLPPDDLNLDRLRAEIEGMHRMLAVDGTVVIRNSYGYP